MPSVSSLLRSAAATRKKIAEQEDAQVAFDWAQSAKTYEDFVEYRKYLDERRKSYADDPSKLLTIDKTISAARRGYTSNEIQRQNINIVEGKASSQDKYNALVNLFYQAVDNGDYDLAQTLNLQLDNLSVKIQQDQISQANSFAAARAAGAKSATDFIRKLEKGSDLIELANPIQAPDGRVIEVVKPLAALARELEDNQVSSNLWQMAMDTTLAIRQSIEDQYNTASTQDQIDKLEETYGPALSELDEVVRFKVGGQSLSIEDLVTAAENEKINNPIYGLKAVYNEAKGTNEYKLTKNNVERIQYARTYNPVTGAEEFLPAAVTTDQNSIFFGQSREGKSIKSQITSEGSIIGREGEVNLGTGKMKRDDSQSIENRLNSFGIEAKQNGTTLSIKLPNENVERTATIEDDGTIRYRGDGGQIFEVALTDKPNFYSTDVDPTTGQPRRWGRTFKAGDIRPVSPEEVSDFAEASAFGGYLSQRSARGQEYLENFQGRGLMENLVPTDLRTARLTGVGAVPELTGPINTAFDVSGRGAPVTTALLQSGRFTQGNIQKEQAAKVEAIRLQAERDAATRLQATPAYNVNQTSIAQWTNEGNPIKQLRVSSIRTPRISRVSVATNVPRITSVGVARPSGRVTVGSGGGLQGF